MRRALHTERNYSLVPTYPNSMNTLGRCLGSQSLTFSSQVSRLADLGAHRVKRTREESFLWIPAPDSLLRESAYRPPIHPSLECLPATFRSRRLPACWGWGWGGGQSRGRGKGVPAPEATHVSSRIFLSATTSPVNLFLALYTTPYVPSPIFSTFWKFSMER